MQRLRFLLCLFAIAAICFATTACSDDKPAETPSDNGGADKPAEKPGDTPPATDEGDAPAASCGGSGKS